MMMRPGFALSSAATAYAISRALRFNSADSAYLSYTGTATFRDTWTFSVLIKRGKLSSIQTILSANTTSDDRIYFDASDRLCVDIAGTTRLVSTPVFRDATAWGHLRVVFNAANATSSLKLRVFWNGTEITSWTTDTRSAITSTTALIGHNVVHNIGRRLNGATNYFDGYLADAALKASVDASWVGVVDSVSGSWDPTIPTDAFWWLSFANNASTTTIGYDDAGGTAGAGTGSQDWTANNFSVTAGVGNDSLTDTPTTNFCAINPLKINGTAPTLTNGNLNAVVPAESSCTGTIGVTSGKWFWEVLVTAATETTTIVGIVSPEATQGVFTNSGSGVGYGYLGTANKGSAGSYASYGATYTAGDVIGVALDLDAGTLIFYKNGTSQGTAYTGISGTFVPAAGNGNSASTKTFEFNFGQRAFTYTQPSGYLALCASNMSHPSATSPLTGTFTGNASAAGPFVWLGFPPDKTGTCTINGNAITWGTHADALSNGFKLRTALTTYNTSGSNSYSIAVTPAKSFARLANAQINP